MLNVPKIRDTFNIGNYENNYGVLYFVIICKITGYLSLIQKSLNKYKFQTTIISICANSYLYFQTGET